MTAPNRNSLWARAIIDELAQGDVERIVIAPGSRSTPLTVAADSDERIQTYSHLDERSAGFFALGQGKRRGTATALVCTSGTAAANVHPAVVEATQSRTPLLVLTADRPPERWDSGANQTIDQQDIYGSAPRFARTLPEPEPTPRKLRSLRTTVARAVAAATGTEPGPAHLNVPFKKPLAPIDVDGDIPADLAQRHPEAVHGRDGPFVRARPGMMTPSSTVVEELASTIEDAERGLIVAGPSAPGHPEADVSRAITTIASVSGFPILADPLSGLRFGDHVPDLTVLGGYDGYIGSQAVDGWPAPTVVLRFGASPTSKTLRTYLQTVGGRQYLVDPAAGWREATFTATDLVETAVESLATELESRVNRAPNETWHDRFSRAERVHWETVSGEQATEWEGWIPRQIVEGIPDPASLFISNSMPVRDLDRFVEPRTSELGVIGNRGASGIDGIASSGLGIASVATEPAVLLLGDLAFFHDANGLLALERFGIDATIVVVNNDGGGIFHMLPIEDFDPPFEAQFRTPHDLDFEPLGEVYGFEFARVRDREDFVTVYSEAVDSTGTQVIEVQTDAERSHRIREQLEETVSERLVE